LLLLLSVAQAKKKLVIHLIPHSHNDAGWLNSFEGYYRSSTEKTLTNSIDSLLANKNYTFHWADIAFFNRWWNDQNDERKKDVKMLVKDNRLIFINGGWVINDEALPAYKETISQMRTGLDFLKENFGVRPHIGWQIDPFGSTAQTVSVFHKLGFSAFIENRISNDFKDELQRKDGFNFFWQGHQVDADKKEDRVMTHILQYFYTLPGLRLDSQFISTNKKSYANTFWGKKVEPVIIELNK
jgi:lysosomal alpha-mannosidase